MLAAIALFLTAASPEAALRSGETAPPQQSRPVMVRATATILRSGTTAPQEEPGGVRRQVRSGSDGPMRVEFE
jgi:hypothetical protein